MLQGPDVKVICSLVVLSPVFFNCLLDIFWRGGRTVTGTPNSAAGAVVTKRW